MPPSKSSKKSSRSQSSAKTPATSRGKAAAARGAALERRVGRLLAASGCSNVRVSVRVRDAAAAALSEIDVSARRPPLSGLTGLPNSVRRAWRLRLPLLGLPLLRGLVGLRDASGTCSRAGEGRMGGVWVECKAYAEGRSVPLEDVAKFREVLRQHGKPPGAGVFVTTARYTPRAAAVGVPLVDGAQLRQWERAAKASRSVPRRVAAGGARFAGVLVVAWTGWCVSSGIDPVDEAQELGGVLLDRLRAVRQ